MTDRKARDSRGRTRVVAIVMVVALVVGTAAWVAFATRPDDTIPADIDDWRTFASIEAEGWTIQVPPPWHVTELPACENAPERIGLMVTSVEFEFRDPRGGPPDCEDRLVFAGFPRNGVALGFYPRGVLIGIFSRSLDTTLPLTPELLTHAGGIRGGPEESFTSVSVGEETLGVIRRFVGPEASTSDVAALDRTLASFRARGAPRWIVEDDVSPGSLRVSVRYPSAWQMWIVPLELGAPPPVVQLMSPGVVSGGCRVFPWAPWIRLDGIVANGGVVVVLSDIDEESDPHRELPPRPDHFRLGDVERESSTCGGRVRAIRFEFVSAGRSFQLDLAATWDVYANDPRILRYILDSIEISEAES